MRIAFILGSLQERKYFSLSCQVAVLEFKKIRIAYAVQKWEAFLLLLKMLTSHELWICTCPQGTIFLMVWLCPKRKALRSFHRTFQDGDLQCYIHNKAKLTSHMSQRWGAGGILPWMSGVATSLRGKQGTHGRRGRHLQLMDPPSLSFLTALTVSVVETVEAKKVIFPSSRGKRSLLRPFPLCLVFLPGGATPIAGSYKGSTFLLSRPCLPIPVLPVAQDK